MTEESAGMTEGQSRRKAMEEEVLESDGMPITVGTIVASALVAGTIAFLLRRALSSSEDDHHPADRYNGEYLRDRAATMTNEFVRERIAPELKPVLLTVLREVRQYVDRGFQRAEHALKDM
jgi:hypothetical protein